MHVTSFPDTVYIWNWTKRRTDQGAERTAMQIHGRRGESADTTARPGQARQRGWSGWQLAGIWGIDGWTAQPVGWSASLEAVGGRRSIRRFPRPLVSSLASPTSSSSSAPANTTQQGRRSANRSTAPTDPTVSRRPPAGRVVFRAILSTSSRFRRLALPPVVHLPRRERKHERSEVDGRAEPSAWKSGLTAA